MGAAAMMGLVGSGFVTVCVGVTTGAVIAAGAFFTGLGSAAAPPAGG